jgi:hypothetical protein
MLTGGNKEFSQLSEDLSKVLLVAARDFFNKNGLEQNPNTSLNQMSTSLEEVSRELLMFGADEWPAGIAEDDADTEVETESVQTYFAGAFDFLPEFRPAAMLVAGVLLGCVAYSPLAQALRPPAFTLHSAKLVSEVVHPGEELAVTMTSHLRKECQITVDRLFLDTKGKAIARWREPGGAHPITAEPITRHKTVPVPASLKPGNYVYRGIFHFDCDDDETVVEQMDLPFALAAESALL